MQRGAPPSAEPPQRLRARYYLFEVRMPPAFVPWAEQDIASSGWLVREVLRLVVVFLVVTLAFGDGVRPATLAVLGAGMASILGARNALRRIAVAYQRYGWDWDESSVAGSPYLRTGLAVVFAAVLVLLAR